MGKHSHEYSEQTISNIYIYILSNNIVNRIDLHVSLDVSFPTFPNHLKHAFIYIYMLSNNIVNRIHLHVSLDVPFPTFPFLFKYYTIV